MEQYKKQFINGEWIEGTGESMLENYNPYTGDLLYEYQSGSAGDVDKAYKAAKEAQPKWENLLPSERGDYLEKLLQVMVEREDDIRELLIKEGGSAPSKVDFEVNTSRAIIREGMTFPEHMNGTIVPSNIKHKSNYIIREAKGVIGVISPWNVPFVLSLRSVIPAIATGNTVVLKPASDTPASALMIAEMFEAAEFPPGVFNVVMGKGSEIGDSITEHPIPNMISFTGSTEVGQHIGEIAASQVKDVSLELGGNNAMIVLEDADIEDAVNAAVFGTFFNAGQNCIRINRLVLLDGIYEEFKEKYVKAVKEIQVGDPNDPDTYYGPVINGSQRDQIVELVEDTIDAGATVELEGRTDGNVIHPWILGDVTNDMPTAANEVFGPAISLIRVQDEIEAIEVANDTNYGLSGAVFTGDKYHGMQVAQKIESGMVHVNDMSINDEPHVMFGGEKESGMGRFNGQWVKDAFTRERWISVQEKPRF
jgi:aldehyde dehydrogenase (NAD+)